MKKRLLITFVISLLLAVPNLNAQGQLRLLWIDSNGEAPELRFKQSELLADSAAVLSRLKSIREELIEAGYLMASVDELQWNTDTVNAQVYIGDKFEWAALHPGNVPEEYLSRIGYRQKVYENSRIAPAALAKLFKKLLQTAENNGYPFASIKLDSVEINQNKLDAVLNMTLNTFTVVDSFIIKGGSETNRSYIENHIGIKKGSAFEQRALSKIPNRLRELPFVKVIKPYEVGMRPGKADIYLYIDNKKASNFDGVLGVLPDNQTGEILITGDVKLNLLNSFKAGETIKLQWQRLQTRTQQLDVQFKYPFLFETPLGLDLAFNLYRRDTLFSQINATVGVDYFFLGSNSVSIYYQNLQANVISASVFTVDEYVDSRTNLFGVGANVVDLDYRFNPRSGYFVEGRVAAGTKNILKNSEIDDSEYEDVELESELYNANIRGGVYFPFGKRSAFLVRGIGGAIINNSLFRNELFRIGGLKTLRGFDEQAIFASSYLISTLEYRFILEQNSNIFLFVDQAWYEDTSRENLITDTPLGFGAGISFETGAGVFSLTYALGQQFDNDIEVRNGKIHFGFTSFF